LYFLNFIQKEYKLLIKKIIVLGNEKQEEQDKREQGLNSEPKSSAKKFLKKQSELTDLELEKIKLLNEIDQIIGVSELSPQATRTFVEEQKMTNICFIIDPEKEFNTKNNINFRYEMILEGDKLIDLKFDPNGKLLAFEYFSFVYYSIVCFVICGWGLYICLRSLQHDFAFFKYYRDIYLSNILISKISYE
jgi:hypothetical protein